MVTFHIMCTVTETDFGDRRSWSSSALTTAHDDEATVRRMTNDVASKLREHGVTVHIEESTSRIPFPRDIETAGHKVRWYRLLAPGPMPKPAPLPHIGAPGGAPGGADRSIKIEWGAVRAQDARDLRETRGADLPTPVGGRLCDEMTDEEDDR